MKQNNVLSKKELKYEKLNSDPKKRKAPKKQPVVVRTDRSKFVNFSRHISIRSNNFYSNLSKFVNKSKKAKKTSKKDQITANLKHNNAILGIGLLLVVVSIAYSTTVIFIGVDSIESKIALLPQVIFALTILIKAFSRLYK